VPEAIEAQGEGLEFELGEASPDDNPLDGPSRTLVCK